MPRPERCRDGTKKPTMRRSKEEIEDAGRRHELQRAAAEQPPRWRRRARSERRRPGRCGCVLEIQTEVDERWRPGRSMTSRSVPPPRRGVRRPRRHLRCQWQQGLRQLRWASADGRRSRCRLQAEVPAGREGDRRSPGRRSPREPAGVGRREESRTTMCAQRPLQQHEGCDPRRPRPEAGARSCLQRLGRRGCQKWGPFRKNLSYSRVGAREQCPQLRGRC
jgi:hypothetical protein